VDDYVFAAGVGVVGHVFFEAALGEEDLDGDDGTADAGGGRTPVNCLGLYPSTWASCVRGTTVTFLARL